MTALFFDARELARLRPPDLHSVADWADANRILDPIYSPGEPGPYSSARTPYLAGIWDAWLDPSIRQVTFIKSTQVGGTEALMNMIGHAIEEAPAPMMLVLPSQSRAREFKDRISAMVDASPSLRQFAPQSKADDLRTQVRYGASIIYYRGAESPGDLASVAVKRAIIDEADKTPTTTAGGREAGTVQLVRHRLRTVLDSCLYINSTPTTRAGPIWAEWEKSDQRYYEIPCPHCGTFQKLEFARIRWPEGATAESVEMDDSATYHCVECDGAIDARLQKAAALQRGRWKASKPRSKHAGFHISALYSPWLTWSQIAAEHLRATTVETRRDFTNGYLGWVFEEQVDRIDSKDLKSKAGGYAVGEIPEWVRWIVCGVDCGKREIHYDVRGFGAEGKTALIEAGRIVCVDLKTALNEFAERVLERDFGGKRIRLAFIDAGFKPHIVARFCVKHSRCKPIIGRDENKDGQILTRGAAEKTIAGKIMSYPVIRVDVTQVQDQIADTMHAEDRWHVPSDVPEEWFKHMAAEHAVIVRKSGRDVKRWLPLAGGGANHWLDACRYAFAAAYALKGWWIKDREEDPKATNAVAREEKPRQRRDPPPPAPPVLPRGTQRRAPFTPNRGVGFRSRGGLGSLRF